MKKIVQTLKREDELDNTVIIFVSDNGYFEGEHRIAINKTFPYEEALRVPLAIRVPSGVIGGQQPARRSRSWSRTSTSRRRSSTSPGPSRATSRAVG